MQIKDLAIGDGYVCLMEGSTKVKFYALYHNYESGLNGKGRTLFCRESPATSGPWSSVGSAGRRNDIAWGITDHGASGETHTCSMGNFKISTATIVRTACLLLALANQMLSAMGKPIIPIRISPMLMPSAFTP